MKIFGNYEKNLSLYDSITRSRKRSVYFYFVIGSIFLIFLFFCPQIWYYYAVFGLLAFGFYMIMLVTIYYLYKYPKKVKIFDEIVEDYRSGKILKEINRRGIHKDKLDCVISPYRYIRIACIKNDNVYTEVRIESTRHGYATELTPDFAFKYPKRVIVSNFRKYIGRYNYIDNKKELTKKEFYNWVAEIFKDDNLARPLNEEVRQFLLNNKTIDENNKED